MNLELVGALNELERERGISKAILLEAIEAAIVSAYKRNEEAAQNVRVSVSETTGQIQVFAQKEVVDEVVDEANEISLEEARRRNPNYKLGDIVEIEVTPRDFGRIAAQTAKQVVIQRIREAERALVFEEYSNREGDVVTGIVQRSEYRNILVDLGKVEAILPPSEQIPKENYTHGTRIKTYVSEVRQTTKGPQVIVSRTHPGLLKRLFELEVPEIHDGVVEIKAVAREAGNRSKIAVWSSNPNVDPVGACVGPRGMRVQTIVQELRGEKIDIVEWDPDPARFIANALSPARVLRVFVNEEEKSARAVVPDHQLSLAIGREGQNARLAARLTGWKIDIKSDTQMAELALLEAQRRHEALQQARAEAEAAKKAAGNAAAETEEALVAAAEVAAPEVAEPVEEIEIAQPAAQADEAIAAVPDEAAAAPEEPPVEEPAAAEVDVREIPIEIPREIFDKDEVEEAEEVLPKARRSRAARKVEFEDLKDLIDDEVLDEELPTLFGGDDEEGGEASLKDVVFVANSEEPAFSEPRRGNKKKGKASNRGQQQPKDKLVLKDLAELKALLDAKDREES